MGRVWTNCTVFKVLLVGRRSVSNTTVVHREENVTVFAYLLEIAAKCVEIPQGPKEEILGFYCAGFT